MLIYPGLDSTPSTLPLRREFDALAYHDDELDWFWSAYSGGRDITDDPFAAPLKAKSLAGLPPAFIVLGGCDFLRDEGRLHAARLREDGVDAKDICYPGQIHGFMNHMHPAAAEAYDRIGTWVRALFERTEPTAARSRTDESR